MELEDILDETRLSLSKDFLTLSLLSLLSNRVGRWVFGCTLAYSFKEYLKFSMPEFVKFMNFLDFLSPCEFIKLHCTFCREFKKCEFSKFYVIFEARKVILREHIL